MNVLHFSIFIILVSIMIIPNALASHDSDKQWGTVSVDKPVLELPYTTASNTQYEKIKIFGTVVDPRSATWVYLTLTEPGGKTSDLKIVKTTEGYYETFIQVCCNNIGEYTVSASWKGHNIGTVTFDVVLKIKPQTTSTPAPTTTEDEQTEDQQQKQKSERQKQKSEQQKQKSKRGESKSHTTQTEESATDQHETKKKDSDCKRKCRS